jgi:hypothetical protein
MATVREVGARAVSYAALFGIVQIGLAEATGITGFHRGYCCGFERDILPTYANVIWFGAVASCLGAVFATISVPRKPVVRSAMAGPESTDRGSADGDPAGTRSAPRTLASRVSASVCGAIGAALALPVVAYVASRAPSEATELDVSPGAMIGAYTAGIALGFAVGLLVVATPAYRSPVPLGIVAATCVYWLIALVAVISGDPLRLSPGGIQLGRMGFAGIPSMLVLTVCALVAVRTMLRLSRGTWRQPSSWVTAMLGVVALGMLVWAAIELGTSLGGPLARLYNGGTGFGSSGAAYGFIGLGIALGLPRRTGGWIWLPLASVAGFGIVVGALRLALVVGPSLSGDGALSAAAYDIVFGLCVAVAAGALVAAARLRRHPAVPAPFVTT